MARFFVYSLLFLNYKLCELLEESICGIVIVYAELDGLKQIKAENTHNGFSVNDVASGCEVNVALVSRNCVYEISDVHNCRKSDVFSLHIISFPRAFWLSVTYFHKNYIISAPFCQGYFLYFWRGGD